MSSRESILANVTKNKPELSPLPEINIGITTEIDTLDFFKNMLKRMGGKAIEIAHIEEVEGHINEAHPEAKYIFSYFKEHTFSNFDANQIKDELDFDKLDLVVLPGSWAIAENACIWLDSSVLAHRSLPFITQHLALVIDKNKILHNMHQAYSKINIKSNDYGVFVAGPSKTADIEQSLVIGAHGPRSLIVFII